MKVLKLVSQIIFIACLPLLFLTLSITTAFNAPGMYNHSFNKFDIAQVTGISNAELESAGRQLIDYFNSNQELADVTVIKNAEPFSLFNEREILHLKDVKALVNLNYAVMTFSAIYILGYLAIFLALAFSEWRKVLYQVIAGSVLTLAVIAMTGILALMDFNWLFLQFHLISFSNDLWLLDPAKDYLIMMFPEGFWFDAAFFIAGLTSATALLTGACACWLAYRRRNN